MLQVLRKTCKETDKRPRFSSPPRERSCNSASCWYQEVSYSINYCHLLPFSQPER